MVISNVVTLTSKLTKDRLNGTNYYDWGPCPIVQNWILILC